jgi:hypothetical protein
MKVEYILSTEINLTTSDDEGEEYLFISSKSFNTNRTKLAKLSHPAINHCIGSESHCQQWVKSAQSAS